MAIMVPSYKHAECKVTAISAREKKRAFKYASTHDINRIHDSYQDLLDDSSIHSVYIPLPNSLHFEWTLKALKAGMLEECC